MSPEELAAIEHDYRADTAVHALVRSLVGELRAERTRTQDLRKKFVNAASWWHTTHEATEGRWDDCVNWICQDAREALSAGDET